MIGKKVVDELNKQVNEEMFSAYLYLSMNAYFESLNLKGFANWMKVQVQEELAHAMKFYDFIIGRGGRVVLDQLKKPKTEWKSPLDAFEAAYAHEQHITGRINTLVNLAIEEKDHATNAMLQWFVTEQVEEEANTSAVTEKLKLAGDKGAGLFMMDQELARRVFVPPAPAAL
jgi:ferritin